MMQAQPKIAAQTSSVPATNTGNKEERKHIMQGKYYSLMSIDCYVLRIIHISVQSHIDVVSSP